jgi:glycosyltransferase involved in cell wall biosynthesis
MRGGEKVLEEILDILPAADIYTLICDRDAVSEKIKSRSITTSFLQAIPGIFGTYRNFLPFFPAAIESFDMSGYDLIISSSHCAAKAVRPAKGAKHFCYCHTPMRYAWDQFHNYFSPERNGRMKYSLIDFIMPFLRSWDRATVSRVGYFMANSTTVQSRIREYYGRESEVIHPPVDTDFFTPYGHKEEFYLMVSALTEYKKVDFAVDIFNGMPDKKLLIIGGGPLLDSIRAQAGPNITVMGYGTDEEIRDAYRRAKAFIFPGEEDFGITMAESLACGTPVLALNKGGSLDIISEGETGGFYDGTAGDFIKTLEKMGNKRYDVKKLRESSLRFSRDNFTSNFKAFLAKNGVIL